jgi:hypothetical protein
MFVEAPQAQVSREYLGQYLVKQLFNVQARKQEARKVLKDYKVIGQ